MSVVYAAADLHGNLPEVPGDADALLLVGDICPDYASSSRKARGGMLDKGGHRQANWLNTEFRAWLGVLWRRNVKVVAAWGNHDFVGEHPFLVPRDLPWTLLTDRETTLRLRGGDLRIYGTPWVPGLPYWAFYGDDHKLAQATEAIPEGLDVLMTHGPPLGAGDFIASSPRQREKYGNYDGMHVGSPALGRALVRSQPGVTVCGHIHEAYGVYGVDGYEGAVYNVAAVTNVAYDLREHPFTRIWDLE